MGRTRARLSQGLIGILAIVIAIGLIFYVHHTSSTKAAEKPGALAAPPVLTAIGSPANTPSSSLSNSSPQKNGAPTKPSAPEPLVTAAPTSATQGNATPPIAAPKAIAPTKTAAPEVIPASAHLVKTEPPARATTPPTTQSSTVVQATPTPLSTNPLGDGKAKIDAGDLLAARRILNSGLLSGQLSDADTQQAKSMMSEINQTIVFSSKPFADDEFGGTYTVQPGENLTKIAALHGTTAGFLCRINGLADARKLRANATIKVVKGPFYAQVDKSKFNMEIWVGGEPYTPGSSYVTSYPVGLGKDDSTPDGKWLIQPGNKIKDPTYYSPRGEGVIPATDPKNPLGHFWLGLVGTDGHAVGKMSYGIHGNIDADSIGKQESMGCIRMKNDDIAVVFELLVEGKSTVTVK